MDSIIHTILIHGYGFDHRSWYPLELAFHGHRVTYLALPGFGMEPVLNSYSIAGLAEKYWRHLDETGIEMIHLAGHSMGGYVCLEMLAQQPDRVSSLVLIHSHVFKDNDEKKLTRTTTMNDIKQNGRAAFVKNFYSGLFSNADLSKNLVSVLVARGMQYDDNAWYYGAMAMRDRTDHTRTLEGAKIPVLLLMGEDDKAVPVELALKQSTLAERTSIHLYPSTGHMGMYENTHQLLTDLIDFYKTFVP